MKFMKIVAAVICSLLIVPAIIVSCFSIPLEFIAFNAETYTEPLRSPEIEETLRTVFSEAITHQFQNIGGKGLPPILGHRQALENAFLDQLPANWVKLTAIELKEEVFDHLNFRFDSKPVPINIVSLKKRLSSNSDTFSETYLSGLPHCELNDTSLEHGESFLDIYDYPQCNPIEGISSRVTDSVSQFISDYFATLPDELELAGLIPESFRRGSTAFANYSMIRWMVRLAPVAAISLLIALSLLLQENRKLLWHWSGLLLLLSASLLFVALIGLLIGQNTWAAYFANMISGGEDQSGLSLIEDLIAAVFPNIAGWTGAFGVVIWLFGLILYLAGKHSRRENPSKESEASLINTDDQDQRKSILPETLEDVEQKEKRKNANLF